MNGPPRRSKARARKPLDVAIVGLACRFPGSADVASYWSNILAGRDCTSDVPASRWDADVFCEPDSSATDRVYCRRGGYLDEPIPFDPSSHGVMPLAVSGGEPEQFLVLDAARTALDDAGYLGGIPHGERVEVVVGRGNYFNRGNLTRLQHGRIVAQTLAILRALHPEWSEADLEAVRVDLRSSLPPFEAGTIAGQLTNATSGRVSNRLDLGGASFVVDAASASSLVALDLAARSLVEGRSDLAIVAGVYLQPDVDFPLVFSRLNALSRRGSARPFSATADGTLPGEGVGVVVLKRRSDAERERNRVYALLQSVGLASDGRATSLAAPSVKGHARAIRRAYRQSGIDPTSVDMVEGHGLGVPASDAAELKALRTVFPQDGRGPRVLGAVSSLIGHAMPAAGMAGLIKAVLSLHHRVLPMTPHADEPHPMLRDGSHPFALNAANRPWVHGRTGSPRRAGVNAFGFAGVNAHAVLEEYCGGDVDATAGFMTEWDSEVILLGAPDRARWLEIAAALENWLASGRNDEVPLKDLAATLNPGQTTFPFRVGLVVGSPAELRERLTEVMKRVADPRCRSIRDARGTYFWEESLAGPRRLAFLYPGEGSQYPGMLADLFPHFPELRAVFDTADRIAIENGRERLPSDLLYRPDLQQGSGLWAIDTAVTVVLTSQWALHLLLSRLGLRPDAVVGHSSGELLALAASGTIQADRFLEDRLGQLGSIFEALEREGRVPSATLVAVAGHRAKIQEASRDLGLDVRIAMDNCPHQAVMSGEPAATAAVVARLREQGVMCEPLPYNRAYHTPGFAPALEPVQCFFDSLPMERPDVAIYSCATAAPMGLDVAEIRRLAVHQWCEPVAFRETIERMYADGVRLFVEVGARGNLTGFVEDTLRGKPHFAVAANLPRRSGLSQLNHLVAAAFAQGLPVQTDHLYARRRPRTIDLSQDLPPSRPVPELLVGFPEMRLSDAMIRTLREKASPPPRNGETKAPPLSPSFDPALPRDNPPAPEIRRENGHAAPAAMRSPGSFSDAVFPLNRMFTQNGDTFEVGGEGAERDQTVLSYLRTMDVFLETQRQVMEAYLSGSSSPTAPAVPSFDHSGPEFHPAISAAPVPETPEVRAAPVPSVVEDASKVLLDQVSQRTGYPREMLDLDLDMEGDLGIDSIKRVEILGELQNRGHLPEGIDLERLSRCRTLQQVIDLLQPARPELASAKPEGWIGDVVLFQPGREFVGTRWLTVDDDPVARHHTLGGRRLSAVEPDRLGLPVVPFTIMAELLAQAGAVLCPGQVVVEMRDLQANRWIKYESEPVALEIRAERDAARPSEVRVSLRNLGVGAERRNTGDGPTVSGVVVFAQARPVAPTATPWRLEGARRCRFEAEELYRDQWLFHGPAMQAVTRVGESSPHGIEGTIQVLPLRDLLPVAQWPRLFTDPIVLDNFTHLLGCWGIDKQGGFEGDVIFPLRLSVLRLFESDPSPGVSVECQIRVREVTRHRVRVDAELVRADGKVWMALDGWEDWRFYWPECYRDVFRMPDRFFVGEPTWIESNGAAAVLVWMEPPADMGKPVWRDVLEWVQLEPEERMSNRALGEYEPDLTLRIWERVAAKEAVRQIWESHGGPPAYPADLVIETDAADRLRVRHLASVARLSPSLAMAHAEGVAVGLASIDPEARLGVCVVKYDETPNARHFAAREALARALGTPGAADAVEILNQDLDSTAVLARPDSTVCVRCPEFAGAAIRVATAQRGDYTLAWTLCERIGS